MLSRNRIDVIEFAFIILTLWGLFVIISSPYITNATIAFLITLSMIALDFVVINLLEGYVNVKELYASVKKLHLNIPKLEVNLIEFYVDITELIQKYKSIVIGAMVLIGAIFGYYWIEQPLSPCIVSASDQKSMTNSIGMELIQMQTCWFYMGPQREGHGTFYSSNGTLFYMSSQREGSVHKVIIAKAFYIGQYEVTQKQWRDVMGNNPSYFKGDDLPVENVTWYDVQEFIKKLNEKEGTNKYRLPSEAEWEYAARAGTNTKYFFGDDESKLKEYAWYGEKKDGKTHPMGQKKPNPWGLYDIYGNVWEWVQDKWHDDYKGAPADGSAWESGDDTYRVARGGGWFDDGIYEPSSAERNLRYSIDHYNLLGFRLAKDI